MVFGRDCVGWVYVWVGRKGSAGDRVQNSNRCGEEAVSKPAGVCLKAPEMPCGKEKLKKICRLNEWSRKAVCRVKCRQWSPCDALGNFYYPLQCLVVSTRPIPIPDCDTVGQDALYCTAVKVLKKKRSWIDHEFNMCSFSTRVLHEISSDTFLLIVLA